MEYLIAVSSRDGITIHQHFGHTEEFQILKVENNERYHFVEHRSVTAPCHMGEHDPHQMDTVVGALSDCRYVLSAKIGASAKELLRAHGIIPLEIPHFIDYAVGKVMLYDKKHEEEGRC